MTTTMELEVLVAAAAERDESAWRTLWAAIAAPLARIIASPRFLGPVGGSVDESRDIAVAVMGRLRADGFKRLQLYVAARRANPKLHFLGWLRVVAKRVGIDYLRAHPDYVRGERRRIALAELPPSSARGERPPYTDLGTAHQLLAASQELPLDQRRALVAWLGGAGFEAIAGELGLAGPQPAVRMVRSALERLRRRFRA